MCFPVGISDGTGCLKHLCAGGEHDTGPTEESSGIAAWGEAGYNLGSLGVGSWIELLISQQHLQPSNFGVFFFLTKSPNAVIVHPLLTWLLRKARHRKGKKLLRRLQRKLIIWKEFHTAELCCIRITCTRGTQERKSEQKGILKNWKDNQFALLWLLWLSHFLKRLITSFGWTRAKFNSPHN